MKNVNTRLRLQALRIKTSSLQAPVFLPGAENNGIYFSASDLFFIFTVS